MEFVRLDTSSYFQPSFAQREQQALAPLLQQSSEKGLVLITNTHTNVMTLGEEILEQTKLMIHPNSGYDNFDPTWVAQQKFPIVIGHEIRAAAVCEYILACLFQRFTPVSFHASWDRSRQWNREKLAQQNILILGSGHIGQRLEKALIPLCESVQVFDPFKNRLQLDLNKVNVVLVAAGLNPTSAHLIDRAFLEECAPGVTVINAARGGIIKTNDLLEHLVKDPKTSAYLDVFETEPMDLQEFARYPNLFATSHIAGVFEGLEREMIEFEAKVLQDFLQMGEQFTQSYQAQLLKNKCHRGFLI